MRSSAKLKISSQDDQSEEENPFSLWTTGPSSPPFNQHKFNDSLASSPRTPSEFEFEFDSICSLEIKDDPPVSPKLITTSYWGATISSFDAYAPVMKQTIAPLSHPISSTKQPSGPPSPSVRQLMAEEMHGETDDDVNLDFYSAPQTPMPTPPKKSAVTVSEERPLSQDEPSLNSVTCIGRRGKSNSAVLDRRGHDEFATQKNQMLQSSKSESNSHFALWSPSFAWEKSEEEDSGVKKQGSKSCVKWAFKDLLRRTVPSSKAEARYITKTMGASSSKKYLSTTKSSPNISPLASPMHSHSTSMPTPHSTSMSTLRATRPSTPGQSPTYSPSRSPPRRPSTPGRSPTYSPSRSPPCHTSVGRMPAQTFNRMPSPSSPRSPLSPHAIHYQQNKAHSLELNRKTFLPYRQSLLGCLGGPDAFSPEQQVW